MERLWCALQGFGGAMRKQPIRARGKRRRVPAERIAVPPPPAPKQSGELPETYGRTKVVAMVVSPYLVHVYWDLAPKDRAHSGQARLRFHDIAAGAWFDVNVDLAARNWYVDLWSPDKCYSVELGRQEGAAFTPLARSNPIETPRAWPVAQVDQPERTMAAGAAPADQPAVAPAAAAGPEPVSSPHIEAAEPVQPTRPPAPESPTLAPLVPGSATETLQQRLAELYRFRRWLRPLPTEGANAPAPAGSIAAESVAPDLPEILGPETAADLTARLESQFSPGLSSGLFGRELGNKPSR